ncbi:MAG: hypothetical protein E7231_09485 [Cellulosilyticum sp.]|nr:hypothetical protein [Cellulosilyticum sp.]
MYIRKDDFEISIYHKEVPEFLIPFLNTIQMQRLKHIGMNCGCEYTDFPLFRNLQKYSRFQHSLGTALIVWHFTSDTIQTLAALFHDIATPTFAHTIDFLHNDYMLQEFTENATEKIISDSFEISQLLNTMNISIDAVKDYHMYPIADNNSPRISADRLEYTMGNLWRYGFSDYNTIKQYYDNLIVGEAEDGQPELCFQDRTIAQQFAKDALRCSKVYISDEDRYAMQILSELLEVAIQRGVLIESDFMLSEKEIIDKLENDKSLNISWRNFRNLYDMVYDETAPIECRRTIKTKKRYIDPLVFGNGRISEMDYAFKEMLEDFLKTSQNDWICGVSRLI